MNHNSIKYPEYPAKKRFFFGIRSRIVLYFGLLFTIVLIINELTEMYGIPFTNYGGEFRQHRDIAFQSLNLVADLKKERLLRWMEERRDDTRVLSKSRIIRSYVAEIIHAVHESIAGGMKWDEVWVELQKEKVHQALTLHLNLVKTTYGVYDKIQIADALTGIIIASTQNEDLGMDISPHESFSNIQHSGYGELVGIDKGPLSGIFRLFISRIIYFVDNEDVKSAVIIMHINPDDFVRPLLHTGGGLGRTGEALLINQDVEILTPLKHPLKDGSIARPLDYKITDISAIYSARGEEGIIETEDYRGEMVLAAFRYISITSDLGWGMVVKKDLSEVFAEQRKDRVVFLVFSIISIALTFGLSFLIAGTLSRSIRTLNKTALRVRDESNLNIRSQITSSDEIGQLAGSFNTMIHSLQHAQDELITKEKLATIGRFSSSIAHDIRHPLATIKNSSYFLNMTLKNADEKTKKHLNLISSEITYTNNIISGLLDFTQTKKAEKLRTNVNKFVKEYIVEFPFPEQIKVVTEFDNKSPDIFVDHTHFKQILSNLITNAIYATPEDGTLTVKTRRVLSSEYEVRNSKLARPDKRQAGELRTQHSELERDFLEISFADTGSGIKSEVLEEIYEPFFTTKGKGIGLGLSIVKNLVEANDGKITVESDEGKGSTFKIVFPAIND